MRYNFACALANNGDLEGALDMLEPVFATCGASMITIANTDVDLDRVRDSSRFADMVRAARERLGLPA